MFQYFTFDLIIHQTMTLQREKRNMLKFIQGNSQIKE